MKPYDNYEISPCQRFEEPDGPGKYYFEVCSPAEADVWTLYGHLPEAGVEAIGDFSTRAAAEQVYSRITGLPFTGSYKADARLRMMHAGPKLLDTLLAVSHWIDAQIGVHRTEIQAKVQQAMAEATNGTPQGRQPIVIEVRGGVVQDVLNVPPGIRYEIRDYDNQEETTGRLTTAAPAQRIILDLLQYGLATLGEGELEFNGVMYWFDPECPDWAAAAVNAIGWDRACTAIAEATGGAV